jgi:hypothetical protein
MYQPETVAGSVPEMISQISPDRLTEFTRPYTAYFPSDKQGTEIISLLKAW